MVPAEPRLPSDNDARRSDSEIREAGISVNSAAAKRETPQAKATTRGLKPSPRKYGIPTIMSRGISRVSSAILQCAASRPSPAPASINTRPSVTNWLISRPRDAPKPLRTAISRRRLSERTTSRLATFTLAISSSSPGAAQQHQQDRANVAHDHIRQRRHVRALPAIGIGVLTLQLLRDRHNVRRRRLQRYAVLKPRDSIDVVTASPIETTGGRVHRSPELRLAAGREMEIARQHSNHDVRKAVERDGLPQHFAVAAVTLLPRRVAQHNCARGGGLIFALREVAAQNG